MWDKFYQYLSGYWTIVDGGDKQSNLVPDVQQDQINILIAILLGIVDLWLWL